jgi:hypothetical protein
LDFAKGLEFDIKRGKEKEPRQEVTLPNLVDDKMLENIYLIFRKAERVKM